MNIKLIKYLFCILCILITQVSFCQIYGIARQVHAAESSKRINKISIYRSLTGQKKVKKVKPNLDKKKMYLSSIENYNEDDQLRADKMIENNGRITSGSLYKYDNSDRLIGIKRYWENDSIYIKRQYLNNKIIIHDIINNQVKSMSIQYLNHNDKIIDWIFLNPKKDTLKRYQYEYDDRGNEICFQKSGPILENNYRIRKYYTEDDEVRRSEEYDFQEKLIEEIDYVEIESSQLNNSNYRLLHRKAYHRIHEGEETEKFETETKKLIDNFNNTIKIYNNQNCGVKGEWNITYLDIEYEK